MRSDSRCTDIAVETRLFWLEQGNAEAPAFNVRVTRADGETIDLAVHSLDDLAALIAALAPPRVEMYCAVDEDLAALGAELKALVGRRASLH